MERIRLSKSEKTVLRMVANGQGVCPAEFPLHIFNACVRSLHNKGLILGAFIEGGGVEASIITQHGRLYMAENPHLANPVNWSKVSAIVAVIGGIVSVTILLVACCKW